jgi:hypothetical protein
MHPARRVSERAIRGAAASVIESREASSIESSVKEGDAVERCWVASVAEHESATRGITKGRACIAIQLAKARVRSWAPLASCSMATGPCERGPKGANCLALGFKK